MAAAVELAALVGTAAVDAALAVAAEAHRFDDGAIASICDHLLAGRVRLELVRADETHSVQPGTSPWQGFGR
jgi:hypothetical protein